MSPGRSGSSLGGEIGTVRPGLPTGAYTSQMPPLYNYTAPPAPLLPGFPLTAPGEDRAGGVCLASRIAGLSHWCNGGGLDPSEPLMQSDSSRRHGGAGAALAEAVTMDPSDDRVLFLVIDRLARAFLSRDLSQRIVAPTGLALEAASLRLLARVGATAPTRVGALATDLMLSSSTISRQLRDLDEAGFLVRAEDPADRRAQLIDLTPAGRDAANRLVDEWYRLAAQLFGDWTIDERATLVSLGSRLATSLRTANPG